MNGQIRLIKQLPFKQIIPTKTMGLNNKLPFNSIVSQSKLLYFAGRSIILENIKTYQQKIIWTNEFQNPPETIEHIKNTHRQNILGIVIRDNSQNHMIFILHINSAINDFDQLTQKDKKKDKLHYFKNIDNQDNIQKLRFISEGRLFAIVLSLKGSQNILQKRTIFLYSSVTGECLKNFQFFTDNPLIESLVINRQNYACIIKNEPEKMNQNLKKNLRNSSYKKVFFHDRYNSSSYFAVDLVNLDDLQKKKQFLLELSPEQFIISIKFIENQKKIIAFFLLDSGFIVSLIIDQQGLHEKIRIDIKINKNQHFKKVDEKIKENNLLQKQSIQVVDSIRHISEGQADKNNEVHSLKRKIDKQEYFMPSCITVTSNKVIVGYQGCSFIGIIQYSGVNHQQYKYWYIDDFFTDRKEIESIRELNFSEDGCHCSALVKVNKSHQEIHSEFIPTLSTKDIKSKFQSKKRISFLPEEKSTEEKDTSEEFFNLLQIDLVSGMIEHSYHSESIQETLTCCALNGIVNWIEFSMKNNTFFILVEDSKLCYCSMNINKLLVNDRNIQNKKINELSANFPTQSIILWTEKIKSSPQLIVSHPIVFQIALIYQDSVRFHFYNESKLFEYHHSLNLKNCKSASYSPFGDKLTLGTIGSIWVIDSYTYTVIKKIPLVIFPTEVGNKSSQPTQDKKNFRKSSSMFANQSAKTVSKIQYINNYDIMIQTGNTTLSILLNYEKVMFFGYTTQVIQGNLFFYDNKHHLGVFVAEDCVKVITKCSINSKNKCEELAKLQFVITALKLCGQIDILFLGGKNGVLYFVRWPQFFQNQAIKYPTLNNKLYLFHSAIIDIQISVNYRKLFVTSQEGMIVICDLIHSDDAQRIGKDVSFRLNRKVDFKLPLLNKWLVSASEGQRRAQHFTKLMGNEAEVKINQNTFADEYRQKLQQQLQKQRQRLDEKIKIELKNYEIETGISKLQVDIALTRDEIRSIIGKRESQSQLLNRKIDADLHKVFSEKQNLQKQLKQLQIKYSQEKEFLLKDHQNESKQKGKFQKQQTSQIQSLKTELQIQSKQKMRLDFGMQQNMIEDFQDEFNQAKLFYGGQLNEIWQKSNSLGQQNRRMNIQIFQMKQKIRQFSHRMQDLQNDFGAIQTQNIRLAEIKCQLSQKIVETDKKYHLLIKKTKQLQIKLNQTRTSSEACQMRYDELQKEMDILNEKWNYLLEKTQQNGNEFVQQNNFRNTNSSQQELLKQKISKLKQKKKKLFQAKVLQKDLLKPFEKQCSSQNFTQGSGVSNKEKSVQQKQKRTLKLTWQMEKWTDFKDDTKLRTIKQNYKLQEETKNLLQRYNELMKQHKDLINIQNSLKESIKLQRQKINYEMSNSSKWEKCSFVPVESKNVQQLQVKKNNKLYSQIYNHAHLENKFSSTSCHFSQSSSPLKRYQSLTDNKLAKKHFGLLKNREQDQIKQNDFTENKKKFVSKNLKTLIDEKKATLKLKKQSSNKSLYYGVSLDPKTLKPNKTLCFSLHKQGDQTKFVTQF